MLDLNSKTLEKGSVDDCPSEFRKVKYFWKQTDQETKNCAVKKFPIRILQKNNLFLTLKSSFIFGKY